MEQAIVLRIRESFCSPRSQASTTLTNPRTTGWKRGWLAKPLWSLDHIKAVKYLGSLRKVCAAARKDALSDGSRKKAESFREHRQCRRSRTIGSPLSTEPCGYSSVT